MNFVKEEIHEGCKVLIEVPFDPHVIGQFHVAVPVIGKEQVSVSSGDLHPLHIRHRLLPGILPGEDEVIVLRLLSVIDKGVHLTSSP